MAKKENTVDITGGLSFGAAKEAEIKTEKTEHAAGPAPKPAPTTPPHAEKPAPKPAPAGLKQQKTKRTVRFSGLITEESSQAMDQAIQDGRIVSKNDLINYLLEEYFKRVH